jgi:hypothetical protein
VLAAAALATGCAADTRAAPAPPRADVEQAAASLTLDAPRAGFQVQTRGVLVEPGEDVRWCEVVALPGTARDLFHVARIESAVSAFARDLVVSVAPAGSDTAAIMDVGARVPCSRAGEAFGEDLVELVASRHPYGDQRYADGVGHLLHGGQRLAIDYHYYNEGSEPIVALAKLNFHTSGTGAIRHIARTATFQNVTIYTPPHGSSSHLAECAVTQPMWVGELARRTERHGTTFRVWLSGGERDGTPLWTSLDPLDTEHELPEPLWLAPGEGFRFECDYRNDTDVDLRFGVSASDETCALHATWWAADDTAPAAKEGCLLLAVDADGVAR